MEDLVPIPGDARTFTAVRRVRLTDTDPSGRLRLDAVARFLQDTAIEDVEETGWGAPEHLWFVRRIRVDVLVPCLAEREVELVTWCSGRDTVAAGRRWSLSGDGGGRIEVDSVWIHLARDGRPARIGDFGPYTAAAGGRRVTARPDLPLPPAGGTSAAWPLRSSDVDLHGHVNNATYWQAIEHVQRCCGPDPREPLRARIDFREPLDLGDELELVRTTGNRTLDLAFVAGGRLKAVAALELLDA